MDGKLQGAIAVKVEQTEGLPVLTLSVGRVRAVRHCLNVSNLQEACGTLVGGREALVQRRIVAAVSPGGIAVATATCCAFESTVSWCCTWRKVCMAVVASTGITNTL